jgi:hypothetical protein
LAGEGGLDLMTNMLELEVVTGNNNQCVSSRETIRTLLPGIEGRDRWPVPRRYCPIGLLDFQDALVIVPLWRAGAS